MKKYLLSLGLLVLSTVVFGQAKKPTLMVFPSDTWCTQNGYMEAFDNQGTTELVPNYKIALQTSPDLMNVISKINILMADRALSLHDALPICSL